jgi:hypothetical protein
MKVARFENSTSLEPDRVCGHGLPAFVAVWGTRNSVY